VEGKVDYFLQAQEDLNIFSLFFRWHLRQIGLEDKPLTNNVAETMNAIFKEYLATTGDFKENLNLKELHEVVLTCKSFLESEWQALDRSLYRLGEFEVKPEFQKFMWKKREAMPAYKFQTPNDILKQIIQSKTGIFLSIFL